MQRILIVEDEPRLAGFIAKGLSANAFLPTTVEDGRTASRTLREQDFDLAILDHGLPDTTGLEVLRDLRAEGQRLPVIVISADHEIADQVTGLADAGTDFLCKPFGFAELLSRMRAHLRPV